ncbi:MAG TPA: type II toxin-antitoxin system Phd/YefM family antitoxin [Phycicoccus sp.]|nr:type II toxin-antitoxin system Phd/YefM family antitoxin [Phycicoccus sp.]
MNDGATMALQDVKNHLCEVVDQVEREQARVVVTRHGKPAAVLVSADDPASLEETLEVMSRSSFMAQLRDSLAEIAASDAEVLSKDELLQTLLA